jgi:peptidoglycan/LPS O-acetylase OafA/YrhL
MSVFPRLGLVLHHEKYRPDIDGIRAIAVTSVVASHAFPEYLPDGFIGVDIFLVISGYLISSIIMRDLERGSFSFPTFYGRRIRRIFPALTLVLAVTLFFGWYCLFAPEFRQLGLHAAVSALFSENLLLWSEAGYFDKSSILKPTLHLWSLAIEEQFYILWPALLFMAFSLRWGIGSVLSGLALVSFVTNIADVYDDPTAAYYSPFGRAWELLVGAVLARMEVRFPQVLAKVRERRLWSINLNDLLSFLGLAFILSAPAMINDKSAFPGFWALLPSFGTFLLISAGPAAWVNRRILALPPMVGCGLISYPLYLWHWPPLSFTAIIFTEVTPKKAAVCVLFSVIAAWLTFRFVELPIRRGGISSTGIRNLVGGLTGGMVIILISGTTVATGLLRSRLWMFNAPVRHEWSFIQTKYPDYTPNMVGIYQLHPDRSEKLLMIGDSRMAQYAERLDKIIGENPQLPGVVMAIGGGCPPIQGVFTRDVGRRGCWSLRERAFEMAHGTDFNTIIIGGAWNLYFSSKNYYTTDDTGEIGLDQIKARRVALDRLEQDIKRLVAANKSVIFVLDNPQSAKFLLTNFGLRLSPAGRGYTLADSIIADPKQLELHDELLVWARRLGVEVVDPFAALCPNNLCLVTANNNMPVYEDTSHLNPDWAIHNASFIDSVLR